MDDKITVWSYLKEYEETKDEILKAVTDVFESGTLILGQKGEDIAARYLEQHGYTVLDRNWRCGHKELDLVVYKDNTVVFV